MLSEPCRHPRESEDPVIEQTIIIFCFQHDCFVVCFRGVELKSKTIFFNRFLNPRFREDDGKARFCADDGGFAFERGRGLGIHHAVRSTPFKEISVTIPIMKNSTLLESLNPPQQQAVSAAPGHVLVLAGAGSGKTRVLVHRIAWLMEMQQISPYAILAVTFTNKAAYEMRARIEALRGTTLQGMWVGTFHGLAHRLLRAHWQAAELPESFQILDSDDQYRLIRRVQKSLELDESKWPPKQAQWFINKNKEEGVRPEHITNSDHSYFTETMQCVYYAYEGVCSRSGLVDFGELLLRSLEILQKHPDIKAHYQNRFQYILVDEFQDTNTIQYRWLKALAGTSSYLMVVGDDDQSIYSWRGAKIENLHRFSRDYANVKTIRLEQNYRSTQTILNAANAVISYNSNRMGKKLWTSGKTGEPITLYAAYNERDEAHFVVSNIRDHFNQGNAYRDVAILYRSNAQSRVLEESLLDANIAYRIYGGQKFFERAEIKDALAYLRLIVNRHDDAAFERVVNTPTRGIGNTTLMQLRNTARSDNTSMWQTALHLVKTRALSSRALSALSRFLELIHSIDEETRSQSLGEQTDHILHRSGLLDHYKKDKTEKGLSRVENLQELVSATKQFKAAPENNELSPLAAFLAHVALEAGEGQAENHSDCVHLMTLHAAKGLEFPLVFITGMEEQLFPHIMSTEQEQGLEEERRLCYVGMTRAMQKLYLTHAECRRLHGMEKFNLPSRFIQEIPEDLIHAIRPKVKVSRLSTPYTHDFDDHQSITSIPTQESESHYGLQIGQRVKHKKFGVGIIVNYEGHSEHMRIQVKFDRFGSKWLVANYAKLEVV